MNVLYMRRLFTAIFISLFTLCAVAQVAPNASIVTSTTLFCTGVPITYSAVSSSTSNLTYTWAVVPVKGLTSFTDLNSPTLSLTFSGASNYTVYLNMADNAGLTRTVQTTVQPARSAIASFNASLNVVGYPTQLVLTNYSTNNLKHYWKFSDNTLDSSYNVVKEYSKSGNYSVSLLAYGARGCDDTATYDFRISDSSSLTLPNIFTPNGDGFNDVFKPITRGISTLKAWVYNRNGVLVCAWDKPKGGWDGHSTSGEECSDGVYFIALDAFGFDGKAYNVKGTITLIR